MVPKFVLHRVCDFLITIRCVELPALLVLSAGELA